MFLFSGNGLPELLERQILRLADDENVISQRSQYYNTELSLRTARDRSVAWGLPLNRAKRCVEMVGSAKYIGAVVDSSFRPPLH